MTTVSQAVAILSHELGEDESFVRQIARRLIDAGILPKGKGRAVPKIDEAGVVNLLLAVLTTDNIASAESKAATYANLVAKGESENSKFADFLGAALTDLRTGSMVACDDDLINYADLQFQIITTYPAVLLKNVPALPSTQKFKGTMVFVEVGKSDRVWQTDKPIRSVTLPGQCLFQIANAMNQLEVTLRENWSLKQDFEFADLALYSKAGHK